jgi:ABC-type uncharacterized transport system permease subunit
MIYLWVTVACYAATIVLQFRRLMHKSTISRSAVFSVAALGVIFHAITLYQSMVSPLGVDFGFYKISSMIALFFSILLVGSAYNKATENLLLALLPVSVITVILAHYFSTDVQPKQYGTGILSHIVLSILAYSVMTISATHAVLILLQDRRLKSHKPRGIAWGLPPLQTMERLLWEMLVVGMVSLTLAILTGFFYIEDLFAQHLFQKTLLTLLSWVTYAVLLIGHVKNGWRGRTAASWTLSAFAILIIAFMGTKFMFEFVS